MYEWRAQRRGVREADVRLALGVALTDMLRFDDTQVTTQNGEEVFFKIKRNTKLSKLQGAYANKVGKDVNSIRWVALVLSYAPVRCLLHPVAFSLAREWGGAGDIDR